MKHHSHKGHAATLPVRRDPLTAGEQSIFLCNMEKHPDDFMLAVWTFQERHPGVALSLGSQSRKVTANKVDFSHYPLDFLAGMTFENITFDQARLPNRDYVRFLESAGARLQNCTVDGQQGSVTSSPVKAAPRYAAGSQADNIRERQIAAAWAQHSGGANR